MAVSDYRLVAERNPENLTTTVALLINEGWEPLGARKAAAVDSQSPTAAADIIAALRSSGLMASAG